MKSRGDDDEDDDVFMSTTEDAVVDPAAAEKINNKRRSQSLSALNNDNSTSQPADVTVSSFLFDICLCPTVEYHASYSSLTQTGILIDLTTNCNVEKLRACCDFIAPCGPGAIPPYPSLPHFLTFVSIFQYLFLFSLSYSCFNYFLAFYPFPFYQNSPTLCSHPDVVGCD